ncbi:tyrosine-type recombinase/integrase [Angelakisella massiliensis]|uniref:tyrosine-type recombinase/integrase n=1 Tax=Angelakisella massiliensis TaxID=1871018 RepID=UPI0024B1CA06|nr:tyrosine-type recombinase/integrase [Angelakisella massiliensis]
MTNVNQYEAPQLLREFLSYMLTIKGRSPRTVDGYYIDLRFFLRYLKASKTGLPMEEKNLSDVTISDIPETMILQATISDAYGFLNFALRENENNAATRCRKVSSIRAFYTYLQTKTTKLPTNPMEHLETPAKKKAMPKYLTLEESIQLLNAIGGKQRQRDYCMIVFLLNCGMRLSELVGIKTTSFQGDNGLRLLGKGNKERIVFLNQSCLEAKAAYDKVRSEPSVAKYKDFYFLSQQGRPLSPRRVEQILEGHLQAAGLSGRGISPHKLRHTAATLMYQHGHVDIRVLKDVLGHVNLGTTEIYTHLAGSQIEKAADASPLASFHQSPQPLQLSLEPQQSPEDVQQEALEEQRQQKKHKVQTD